MANMFPVSPRDGGACPVRARAVTCWSQRRWHCKVGPPVATKSRQVGVHITPISLWFIVLTTVATSVHKPTNITGGAHIVMYLENHPLDQSAGYTGVINHFYVRQAQELRTYHRSHWPIDQWLTGMVLQVVNNMCSLQVLGGSSHLVSGL